MLMDYTIYTIQKVLEVEYTYCSQKQQSAIVAFAPLDENPK